jgi:hypothetical protein
MALRKQIVLSAFNHLLGPTYSGVIKESINKALDKAVANLNDQDTEDGVKVHTACHWKLLKDCLLGWHKAEHDNDPISGVVPKYLIITDSDIITLGKIYPIYIHSPTDLVVALERDVIGQG